MSNLQPILGIIGGSGVYDIDGLQNTRWEKVTSSFGKPSDSLLFGELDGQKMVFYLDMGVDIVFHPLKLIIALI